MKFNFWYVMRNWHYSSWMVHYITLKNFVRVFEKYITNKKEILFDLGCGRKPYHDLISLYFRKHIGLEYPNPNHHDDNADIYGSAYHTAIKDKSVDTVFTAAVLEHLENPCKAIQEAHRILKKDGLLIITAPLMWHLHDLPRDFYRYTKHGFEYLYESNGFEILEVRPLAGFWVTVGSLFIYYVSRFNRGLLKKIPIIPAIVLLIEFASYFFNKLDPKSFIWTWAYIAVGRKIEA